MCHCDPRIKTMYCGKSGCEWPVEPLRCYAAVTEPLTPKIIPKGLFVGIINLIKSQIEEDERITSALGVISSKDNYPPIYNTLMIDHLIFLLNNVMKLEKNEYVGTDIDWWIWETNFGNIEQSMRTITHKNKEYDIKTSSDLYDWIIESKKGE